MSTDRSALDALAGWLDRGRRAVREDARRALRELVARGDLSGSDARQVISRRSRMSDAQRFLVALLVRLGLRPAAIDTP